MKITAIISSLVAVSCTGNIQLNDTIDATAPFATFYDQIIVPHERENMDQDIIISSGFKTGAKACVDLINSHGTVEHHYALSVVGVTFDEVMERKDEFNLSVDEEKKVSELQTKASASGVAKWFGFGGSVSYSQSSKKYKATVHTDRAEKLKNMGSQLTHNHAVNGKFTTTGSGFGKERFCAYIEIYQAQFEDKNVISFLQGGTGKPSVSDGQKKPANHRMIAG